MAIVSQYFGPPGATFESGISKTTAIIEFPSLREAIYARVNDKEYNPGMIEADGTPIENKIIRDFRVIEAPQNWMKPGWGYWLVWVRKVIDKDTWIGKVIPAWEGYVKSGSCIVHHLKTPQAVFEDGKMFPFAICEFPSLEEAINARNSKDYKEGVLAVGGKPVEEMVLRDFRIIEGTKSLFLI